MLSKLHQVLSAITPTDISHGGLGVIAAIIGLWADYIGPLSQILVTSGGLVLLYYTIRNKRAEWLQRQRDLKDK